MFEKIAKFRLLRARRAAPAPERSEPANDNRPGAVRPGRRRPRLICRWSFDRGPGCHWEIADPQIAGLQEANPLLAEEPPPAGTFTQLSSYRRTTNRLPAEVRQRSRPELDRAHSVAGTSLAGSNR